MLENQGCAGADGVTVEQFAHRVQKWIGEINTRVMEGTYRAFPLLKIVVEKKGRLSRDAHAISAHRG